MNLFLAICLVTVSINAVCVQSTTHNYCDSCADYPGDGPSCAYEQTIVETTEQTAQRLGFKTTTNILITSDGYQIKIIRVQTENLSNLNLEPVLFLHGLPYTEKGFFLQDIDSLALRVAQDRDIFVIVFRGNPGSTGHNSYIYDTPQYWNFHLEDTRHDVEAALAYIKQVTGFQSVQVVCQSVGCTIVTIGSIFETTTRNAISNIVLLTPLIFNSEYFGIPFSQIIAQMADVFKITDFATFGRYDMRILFACIGAPNLQMLECVESYKAFYGISSYINYCRDVPVLSSAAGIVPATYITQLDQNIHDKRFQRYDYGIIGNLIEYGQTTPPAYNLGLMTMNKTFISFNEDNVVIPANTQSVANATPQPKTVIVLPSTGDMSHMDCMKSDGLPLIDDVVLAALGL